MKFAEVLKAYQKSAKGKRRSLNCAKFESQLGLELTKLCNEVNNRSYRPSISRCFAVLNPKPREIWAAHYRDRVIHHIIVSHVEPIFERSFSSKSFACRRGKGHHACMMDLKRQVRKISRGGRSTVWALKLDIESFFVTIDLMILKNLMLEKVKCPEIRWLIDQNFSTDPRQFFKYSGWREHLEKVPKSKSWLSYPENQGIPIGNLTSQFGANLYLNALDHFIERELKPEGYLRYMDDILVLASSKESLYGLEQKWILGLWKKRNQKLNRAKTYLVPLTSSLDYLGFEVKQVFEPKDPLMILPSKKKKFTLVKDFRKLNDWNWNKMFFPHELAFFDKGAHRTKLSSVNSRLGMIKNTKSFIHRKITMEKFLLGQQNEKLARMLLKSKGHFNSLKYDG
ncbi:MAG: hypothetical protein IPK04_11015 [Bdellovibrionales bacterium]|nr:hypothetical protein [Bdellovibrionales bacterium]